MVMLFSICALSVSLTRKASPFQDEAGTAMLEGLREEQTQRVEAEAAEARERRAQYEARKAAREREREEQAAQQALEEQHQGQEGQEEEGGSSLGSEAQ